MFLYAFLRRSAGITWDINAY